MGKDMVKGHLHLEKGNWKETNILENSRGTNFMVKEDKLIRMETSMLENSRGTNFMVKELLLGLMDRSM